MFPSTKDHVQVPYQFSRVPQNTYHSRSHQWQVLLHANLVAMLFSKESSPDRGRRPCRQNWSQNPPQKKNVGKCLKLPSQSVCQSCMDSVHRPCVYARFTRVVVFGYAGLHECHFSRKVARATLACAARFVCGECFREPLLFQACRDEKW